MNDVSEVLKEPLLRLSSSGLEIPLMPLEEYAVSGIDLRERAEGAGSTPRDKPKIQDGFTGPGTSLIAERLLCLRKARYTRTAVQAASASSRYCMAGRSLDLRRREGQAELRFL